MATCITKKLLLFNVPNILKSESIGFIRLPFDKIYLIGPTLL